MKGWVFCLLLGIGGWAYGQKNDAYIKEVRTKFNKINAAKDFQIVKVDGELYGNLTGVYPDGGGDAVGYVKKNRVYKIVETVYTASGKHVMEYYFWDNRLIFVYQQVQTAAFDTVSTSLDFTKLSTLSESRLYVRNSTLIKRLDSGAKEYYVSGNIKAMEQQSTLFTLKKYFLTKAK